MHERYQLIYPVLGIEAVRHAPEVSALDGVDDQLEGDVGGSA
jgi:hypothetical protein